MQSLFGGGDANDTPPWAVALQQQISGLSRQVAELQRAAQDSLALLNWGQTVAMQLGMAGGLLVACAATARGEMSVGDFVMIQLFITQLFRPLSNLGGNYRQLMQSMADMEKMIELLRTDVEVRV